MTNNDELYHYGVPGMKWGQRRSHSEVRADTLKRQTKKLNAVNSFNTNASNALDTASELTGRAARSRKPSKKVRAELSKMSDQELRNKLNRMQMEQQYASLNPSRVSRGAGHVSSALSAIGSLAAIGGSVAAMALAIKQYKN